MPKARPPAPKRRYVRLTRWRRRRFLALLAECGNARRAAELAGIGIKAISRLRAKEPGFAAQMDAARAAAAGRLKALGEKGASGDFGGLVVRRGVGGRLRLMDPGPHWWEPRHDEIFLLHLRGTGNVTASARAAGFTAKVAHDRRKRLPTFDVACEAALAEAEMRLGDVLMKEAAKWLALDYDDAFAAEPPEELDVDRALAMLKYWNRKGKGRGPRR